MKGRDGIYLYMMASKDSTTILKPVDFGRTIQTRKLVPIMFSKPSKPDLERFVYCNCGISKCLKNWSCARVPVQCCIACKCLGEAHKCGRVAVDDDSSTEDSN